MRVLGAWGRGRDRTLGAGLTQRLHVPIQYILRPERASYIGTLGSKYVLHGHMEP